MENLWYILGPWIIVLIVFVIMTIRTFVKKEKHYILCIFISIVLIAFVFMSNSVYIKDLFENDTTEIIVEYIGDVPPPHAGTVRLCFDDGSERIELLAPRMAKYPVKMERGKIYRIEYFDNSKVMKSYTLIE